MSAPVERWALTDADLRRLVDLVEASTEGESFAHPSWDRTLEARDIHRRAVRVVLPPKEEE